MKKRMNREVNDPYSCERQVSRGENRARYEGLMQIGRVYNHVNLERTQNMLSHFYAGVDSRRKREIADGGMVREDRNAMANLPRQAIHTEYPDQFAFRQNPYIDDTIAE